MKGLYLVSYNDTGLIKSDRVYFIDLIDFDKCFHYPYNTYLNKDFNNQSLKDFKIKGKSKYSNYIIISDLIFNKILNMEASEVCLFTKKRFLKKFNLYEWFI
jgi:hypothetical protein